MRTTKQQIKAHRTHFTTITTNLLSNSALEDIWLQMQILLTMKSVLTLWLQLTLHLNGKPSTGVTGKDWKELSGDTQLIKRILCM